LTPSIFTQIIAGTIPCHRITETADFIAFLDIHPIATGHTLVVPKKEIDNLFDLDDALLSQYLLIAKPIAQAIHQAVPCKRVGILVAGLDVPHAHLHLVPIHTGADLNFANARAADPNDLQAVAARIRAHLPTA
jgi:histidine triad (HIT) family protein